MSTKLVRAEIERFLESKDAEALCVKGAWGVGKTYAWNTYLKKVAARSALGLKKYSYVSLFGLNSLDSLRYAIFEGTVTEQLIDRGPTYDSLENAFNSALALGRKSKPLFAQFLSMAGLKNTEETLSRAVFFSVRKQIICIDDLERAGEGLALRDVLGLCSMLKEQRACKVVLLLNDEQLGEKEQFEKILEKVVDTSLVFSPTSAEAAEIALADNDHVSRILLEKTVKLNITNIRVIKKIERFARRLEQVLAGARVEILDSALNTCVLAGWSSLSPAEAPPFKFLRHFNRDVESLRQQREGEGDNKPWVDLLESYGYAMSDDLDVAIFDGVHAGFFDIDRITEAAAEMEKQFQHQAKVNSFREAWNLYHGSLVIDDAPVLDGLFNAARENFGIITPASMNATVQLLREQGRDQQASQLVKEYLEARQFSRRVIEEEFLIWGEGPIDPELERGFRQIDQAFVDARDPKEVLCKISSNSGWNEEDIELLSKQSAEDFERIFEAIRGSSLSVAAKFAIRMGGHDGENYKALAAAAVGGLKRIAAKSPLRARRIASYGVKID